MDSNWVDHEFGEMEVRSNGRIRRYGVKISGGSVILQVPLGGSLNVAISILEKNREWVRSVLEKSVHKEKIYGPEYPFSSFSFDVKFQFYSGEKFVGSLNRKEKQLMIRCPEKEDLYSKKSQSIVKNIISNALVIEAKIVLPERLKQMSEKCQLTYQECKIRNMKTRWGSCSTSGSIHLSSMLLLLPEHLIDFVIIHELCHTKEPNHGRRFHALVNLHTNGREAEFEKEIKKYSPVL